MQVWGRNGKNSKPIRQKKKTKKKFVAGVPIYV